MNNLIKIGKQVKQVKPNDKSMDSVIVSCGNEVDILVGVKWGAI